MPPAVSRRSAASLVAEQADLEVDRPVDDDAVGREPAVGDAEHELGAHDPLDVDAVDDLFHGRQHLAGEFQLAQAERAAFAGRAEPAEEEAEQLPQRVEAEAARHHRVALEMAGEEPEVRLEHRAPRGPVPCHSRRRLPRSRKCGRTSAWAAAAVAHCPSPNSSPRAAGQQILVVEACAPVLHPSPVLRPPARLPMV